MGLLGTIVKGAIAVHQKLHFDFSNVKEKQEDQLKNLLKSAKNTAFGKYYGFEEILNKPDFVKEFQKNVPIHQYSDMKFWWNQQQRLPDITWPGKPDFFALTSGTSGKSSKRVPITNDFIESMRKVGMSLARNIPNYELPEEVFESRVFMLGSSANLKTNELGHEEGEISGINVSNFPDWYDVFYAPGREIAEISDWDERVKKIVEKAPEWDIGSIAGIPSWVLLMLKSVIAHHKVEYIQDIWPNFEVYISGGVAFETYRKDFEKISNKELTIIDTYLASEGFFSYSTRPGDLNMELALEHGYFYEFIPFDERGVDEHGNLLENPEIFTIDEVELNQEYALVISTCSGAWRYVIGDTIKFTQLDPPEILITGRLKFFLNVVGSQLSEEKMNEAIISLAKKMNTSINEYMVAALKDEEGNYYHQWICVSEDELDEGEMKQELDDILKELNNNYKVARSKALKYIEVKAIDKTAYNDYLAATKKKGGQVKTPKVMKEEKMRELLNELN